MLCRYCGITEQSIIEGSSAFDFSGQTKSQCELTVGDDRLLDLADSGVCACVCVNGFDGGDGGLTGKYRARKYRTRERLRRIVG